jgi:hypothetical protein
LNNEAKQGRAGPWMSVAGGITGSLGGCGDAATGLESRLDQFRDAPEIESRCGQ